MICDGCKDKLYCDSYGVEHDSYLCLALTGRLNVPTERKQEGTYKKTIADMHDPDDEIKSYEEREK